MQQSPPPEIPGIKSSLKPHKFFERFLNNDLDILSQELSERYKKIEQVEYNVFQFHSVGLFNLYKSISEMAKEACEYYELDFDKEKFMVQGWFNINYNKKGKLNWHDHGHSGAPNFHGYYCVKAEPSTTYYKVFGKDIINKNIDNRAIFSEMGHPHAQGDWSWDGPRITVAYDVVPLRDLQQLGMEHEQHWIPLL